MSGGPEVESNLFFSRTLSCLIMVRITNWLEFFSFFRPLLSYIQAMLVTSFQYQTSEGVRQNTDRLSLDSINI